MLLEGEPKRYYIFCVVPPARPSPGERAFGDFAVSRSHQWFAAAKIKVADPRGVIRKLFAGAEGYVVKASAFLGRLILGSPAQYACHYRDEHKTK